MTFDFDRLRDDLIDYIGSGRNFMPMAMPGISEIEYASNGELLRLAGRYGFDLDDYAVDDGF